MIDHDKDYPDYELNMRVYTMIDHNKDYSDYDLNMPV